jgi:group I intron endonuclease
MKSILNIPSKSGIYLIKNIITGQSYIGSSINMQKRCNAHRCLLNNNKHTNVKLQRAYIKYGESSFEFKVIEFIDVENLIEREQQIVNRENPYFNIRIVVENSRGIKLSEQTKKRMSDAKKGKPLSEARLAQLLILAKNRIGKPVTGKAKESLKLGPISNIGKHKSQITKDKIRESKLGKKFNKLTRKYS